MTVSTTNGGARLSKIRDLVGLGCYLTANVCDRLGLRPYSDRVQVVAQSLMLLPNPARHEQAVVPYESRAASAFRVIAEVMTTIDSGLTPAYDDREITQRGNVNP